MLTKLYSESPARWWQEGLMLGDGEIGATVTGGISVDRMIFNHEKLYSPFDDSFDFSEKPGVCQAVKAEVMRGNYHKAEKMLEEAFPIEHHIAEYQPLAELYLKQDVKGVKKRYRRTLDFARAEARVEFESDGVHYLKKYFVSHRDGCFAVELTNAEAAPMKATLFLDACAMQEDEGNDVENHACAMTRFTREVTGGDGRITFVGTYPTGDKFGALLVYETDGEVTPAVGRERTPGVCIRNFTRFFGKVTVFAYEDGVKEPPEGDYETLFARHLEVWEKHFGKTSFTLGAKEPKESTERLLLDAKRDAPAPALFELFFAASRYYFLCSTLKGKMPPNLQGIWNGDYRPAWSSDFHNDENVQMCMWQALPFGAFESVRGYMRYYFDCIPDYRLNAKRFFGAEGIAAGVSQTVSGKSVNCGMWNILPGMAGWIGKLFFDYYLYTGDEKILEDEVLPYLEECAKFYESYCTEIDGVYHFLPSMSPENEPKIQGKPNGGEEDGTPSIVCKDATFDVAVAKEVLCELIEGYRVLGRDSAKYRAMLDKLPAYRVNSDGALAEWLPEELGDNYEHRHLSHIYPAFPGTEITREGAPELFRAAARAARLRVSQGITDSSGWGLVHTATAFARLGLGEDSYGALDVLFRTVVMPNLLTYHQCPLAYGNTVFWGADFVPFQIDATLGYAAAIAETFLAATPGNLRVAPSVPKAFENAEIRGLVAPGGITVSLKMKGGKVKKLVLYAENAVPVTLTVNGKTAEYSLKQGENRVAVR